uniref:Uncharacterized protein n=1 Tax=Meloidogyne enterolobii TaxID=390850 RepID=A0A6V7US93_MELEN|nr:unnamed protein product [Meloidogyne enterolobii]
MSPFIIFVVIMCFFASMAIFFVVLLISLTAIFCLLIFLLGAMTDRISITVRANAFGMFLTLSNVVVNFVRLFI